MMYKNSHEVVKTEDLWVVLNDVVVLEGVNLSVKQNDFLGIIGPNGGGKTTLIKTILGLIKPNRGKVYIYDESVQKNFKMLGYVPQHLDFDRRFPITVWETALMGRLGHKKGLKFSKEDKEIVKESLNKTEIYHLRNRPMGKLSGGEKQRVLVARALASKPRILILDEPTASVDTRFETNFFELLSELNKDITIIMVSHDLGALSKHVDKIACLNRHLHYHNSKELTPEMIEKTYNCPVNLITPSATHNVLSSYKEVVGE
ncbi:Zinc ABC transporter, ATP-binding protein ZnuC [Candidatus Syntrophocurvum alkaliphilum]|uniref:Zinc ABC transporter, ATP-binding protein ZnuC n=1 Tax=Candidatus Syntrophocurvum alkaliphilum TaxID=2293317 RepID=A0A6I6DB82_9FIRM|nr:ABC transporter ATP-binding protein [Candidatus Syntrophocurvum alkaliphilum]QGT98705.1 Zinc ABC transporter, ATP-binding protein ZnuC [Candidatus Syntrophocurvum alkaliphilum]